GHSLAGRYQGPGGDHGAWPDHRAVEHDRADADEAAMLQPAAVQARAVADGDVVADLGGVLVERDVDHRAVLNVGARADADRVVVAAQHRAEPYARQRPDLDATDDDRAGRDEGVGRDPWPMAAPRPDDGAWMRCGSRCRLAIRRRHGRRP